MSLANWSIEHIHAYASGRKKMRARSRILAAALFFGHIVLLVAIPYVVDRALGLPGLMVAPWNNLAAALSSALAVVLLAWTVSLFIRAKGTPIPMNPPKSLVVRGPYLHSRNPMLLGWFLLSLGVGLWMNSILVVLMGVPLFIGIHLWEVKNIEEPELLMRFGESYQKYRNEVPILIPRLSRPKTCRRGGHPVDCSRNRMAKKTSWPGRP